MNDATDYVSILICDHDEAVAGWVDSFDDPTVELVLARDEAEALRFLSIMEFDELVLGELLDAGPDLARRLHDAHGRRAWTPAELLVWIERREQRPSERPTVAPRAETSFRGTASESQPAPEDLSWSIEPLRPTWQAAGAAGHDGWVV